MKSITVISLDEQEVSIRVERALSHAHLEGLTPSTKGENLVRKVASGTISMEQALRDLNKLHKVKTRPSGRSKQVQKVTRVRKSAEHQGQQISLSR